MLHRLGIVDLSARIAAHEITSLEATEAMFSRIGEHDQALNSFLHVTADRARDQASARDAEIARGQHRGPLHGVPIAVKDVVDTDYAPTTVGLSFRAGHLPDTTATVVARLEAAGAVMLGKLVTAEGIFVGHHSRYGGSPRNPRDARFWAGASSSGSGVATAAGLCFGAIGTDTGGSIRVPASVHGLTGLKPSWGRVSRHGLFALAPTLDHVGPMTRSAVDAAIMLNAIAGYDPADPTSLHAPVPDYAAALNAPIAGLRIGVDRAYALDGVDAPIARAFEAALAELAAQGVRIVEITMPETRRIIEAWAPICAVETALAHEGTYPERAADYGPELTALLELGRGVSGRDLARSLAHRQIFNSRFALTMVDVDAIAMPTLPTVVPTVETIQAMLAEGSSELGRFTIPPNMTGHPAISLPMGFDDIGHPVGLQFVGRQLGEDCLLRVAHNYQRVTDWHTRHPEIG